MGKLTVTTIEGSRDINSNGKTFTVYQVVGQDETGNHRAPEITFKPTIGQPYDGEFEKTQYGLKFKREKPAFVGGSTSGYKRSPEVEAQIIRQNSLTNAVAYCSAKASHMSNEAAIKYMTGKEIIEVAGYFARYSLGLINEAPKPAETLPSKVGNPLNKEDIDTTTNSENELSEEEMGKIFNGEE